MRASAAPALVVAAAVAAVAVPPLLLWRVAATDPLIDVAPPRGSTAAVDVVRRGATGGRVLLTAPRFPDVPDARVAVTAVVGTARPTVRFRVEARDASGRAVARCALAASDQWVEEETQSVLLACPVSRPSRVRSLAVTARGADGPVSLHGVRLVRPAGRPALERLGAGRPRLLGGPAFLAALALSLACTAAAAAVAARRA